MLSFLSRPYELVVAFFNFDFMIMLFYFFLHSLTWSLFFIFTFFHLYANFRAVSSVVMETVSLPRLHLLVTEFLSTGRIITPEEVGSREPVIFGKVSILLLTF